MAYTIIVALLAVVFAAFLWWLKKRNEYFKHMGIPGPTPLPLFGNLLTLTKRMLNEAVRDWTQQYGKVFGYYEGGTPVLVISDVDMLHEIFVKKFSQFNSRKALPVGPDPETAKNVHMFIARGQRWKRLRMIANPTFSASKLKAMTPMAGEAVDLLVSLLAEKAKLGKPFDIYAMYQALTLDVIGRCAFGIHSDCQRNPKDEFLLNSKQVFINTLKLNWVQFGGILFPEYPGLWMVLHELRDKFRANPFVWLEERLRGLVTQRKSLSGSGKAIDLLQLLLDSEVGDNEEFSIENEQVRTWTSDSDQPRTYKKLLPEEVVSTSLLFLLAGYETTSVALAYTTYFLASNPDVQKKVQEEIDEKFNEEAPYEAMNKCTYLDWVISETLRLFPIATPIQARKCMETCVIGDITIPKGLTIAADVWTIHYDQNIWGPDADKFRPERFSPEESQGRHPMAWLPFGAGPRNCIGMRFALLEAKLTLLKVLKRFNISTCPETEIPPKMQEGATTTPTNGITIVIKERIR